MSRLLKCYGKDCVEKGKKHNKDNLKKIGSDNYCQDCYDVVFEEKRQYKLLTDYISDVYNLQFVNTRVKKQIKDLKEKDGMTYKQIRLSIKYGIEQTERYKKDIESYNKYGINFVVYVFDEMMDYYKQMMKYQGENKIKKIDTREVIIPSYAGRRKYTKENKIIDMNSI